MSHRIVWRDPRREDRHHNKHDHDKEGDLGRDSAEDNLPDDIAEAALVGQRLAGDEIVDGEVAQPGVGHDFIRMRGSAIR